MFSDRRQVKKGAAYRILGDRRKFGRTKRAKRQRPKCSPEFRTRGTQSFSEAIFRDRTFSMAGRALSAASTPRSIKSWAR